MTPDKSVNIGLFPSIDEHHNDNKKVKLLQNMEEVISPGSMDDTDGFRNTMPYDRKDEVVRNVKNKAKKNPSISEDDGGYEWDGANQGIR